MRILQFLLKKEFSQIFRDKTILRVLIGLPIIQLLILPFAANFEIRHINLAVVDHDRSIASQRLIEQISGSPYFELAAEETSYMMALKLMESDKADLVLEIPTDFERNLVREDLQHIFVAVNAINGVKANLGSAYLNNILASYNQHLRIKLSEPSMTVLKTLEISAINRFNPLLDYHKYMVPGILAMLVTMIGGFFSAMNIVKEKEIGTMEQINVTPIGKTYFILGKLIPFWFLGIMMFTIGLLIAWGVYGIISTGSLLLLYLFLSIYLIAILGFGLLVSNFCNTQQQAVFVMFFFMMIFILMGGLFTSIDGMPSWAKTITLFNPVRYFIEVLRMIVLKGSGFKAILPNLISISIFALVFNLLAVKLYKKTN